MELVTPVESAKSPGRRGVSRVKINVTEQSMPSASTSKSV
jgi:hypothetical protein